MMMTGETLDRKITLGDYLVDFEMLSAEGKSAFQLLCFSLDKIESLSNMHAIMQRAKTSYIESVKREMLSNKAGVFFSDN